VLPTELVIRKFPISQIPPQLFSLLALDSFLSTGRDSLHDLVDPSPYSLPVVRGEVKEGAFVIATQLFVGPLDRTCQAHQRFPSLPLAYKRARKGATPSLHLSLSKGEG